MEEQKDHFRLNANKLFLTYPQCDLDPREAWEQLEAIFASKRWVVDRYLVCSELHKDGHPHIHAYIQFQDKQKPNIKGSTTLDIRKGVRVFHGNYASVRSPANAIAYAAKDGNVLCNFDWQAEAAKAKAKNIGLRARVATEMIKNGRTLDDLVKEEPVLLWSYQQLSTNHRLYLDNQIECPKLPIYLPNPWQLNHKFTLLWEEYQKKSHFWVYSGPDHGKSKCFSDPLVERVAAHRQTTFAYWTIPLDMKLLILDEYNHPFLKYSELNQMCDNTYQFRIMYKGIFETKTKFKVVVISNQTIEQMYPFAQDLLKARFNEICVEGLFDKTQKCNIDALWNHSSVIYPDVDYRKKGKGFISVSK